MGQSNNDSNSDGLAITGEVMEKILNGTSGITLKILSPFGNLSLTIQNQNENFGYLLETLSLILQSQKAGEISVKLDLN